MSKDRVTPDCIDANILAIQFHVFTGTALTVCCVTMKNGFVVTGESACVDPDNFDAKIGEEIALEKAKEKIWPLLGFRLKDAFSAAHRHGGK